MHGRVVADLRKSGAAGTLASNSRHSIFKTHECVRSLLDSRLPFRLNGDKEINGSVLLLRMSLKFGWRAEFSHSFLVTHVLRAAHPA